MKNEVINTVICTCSMKDLETWKIVSKQILKKIRSKNYLLIVPDNEVKFFLKNTDSRFIVKNETIYIGNIKKNIPTMHLNRIGWYLQQFIKLAAINDVANNNNNNNDIVLIWDADTVPLKKINFTNSKNQIIYYKSKEYYKSYFDLIEKITGLKRIEKHSFVAQSFAIRIEWIKYFFKKLEERHNKKKWIEILIDNINFNEPSGFSEYETLGTFISHNFKNKYKFTNRPWLRSGNGLIGSIENINKFPFYIMLKFYDFVSFETSDYSFRRIKKLFFRLFPRFLFYFKKNRKKIIYDFLENYFNTSDSKSIIQIGANDGIQNDLLRKFLQRPGNYRATLVEPIPYYINKLKKLYEKRPDIKIIKAAAGAISQKKKLYFIEPKIANSMNGEGPNNYWAHGQGSFVFENIINSIKKNSFRGKVYRSNIPYFISSIKSVDIKIVETSKLISVDDNTLLVVDVQGFEIEVLMGIDYNKPPKYIIIESEKSSNLKLKKFLRKKNYKLLGGTTDLLFVFNK